jgi:hypothetical protein
MGDTIPDGVAASPGPNAETEEVADAAADAPGVSEDNGPNVMLPGAPEELNLAIQNYVSQFNAMIAQNLGTHPGDIEMTAMSIALTFSAARFVALSPDATPERFLSASQHFVLRLYEWQISHSFFMIDFVDYLDYNAKRKKGV